VLFEAEGYAIDLRIAPLGEVWRVSGQALGPGAGGRVMLLGPVAVEAALNDLSEFTLPPVPTGRYTLRLTLDEIEIEAADLSVGP
jgi:hypothetical protein